MDWKQLAKDYPKAMRACLNWYSDTPVRELFHEMIEYSYEDYLAGHTYYRELHDFFDENDLSIDIVKEDELNPMYEDGKSNMWYFQVHNTPSYTAKRSFVHLYKTRKIAEEEGFKNAFNWLESKINNAL